jgi:hypothetical protein
VPTTGGTPTWEQVLAAFEASAAHAQSLAAGDVQSVPPTVLVAGYDIWQLQLPPIPDELRARAESIHQRQLAAAAQLQAAMRSLQQQQALVDAQPQARRALYLDQLA